MAEPFDEDDDLEPMSSGRRKRSSPDDPPGDPGDVEDIDRSLANQLANDYGNAQRLITRYGEDLLWVEGIGWFVWDGARWNRDGGTDAARRLAHQTALLIWREVEAVKKWPGRGDPDDKIKRLSRHAVLTGNTGSVAAMLSAASPYLGKPVEALDAQPYLLACLNGTIELGSHCSFRESKRGDFLTRRCGVEFKTAGKCEAWLKFLARIMPDEEMRDFLQRVLGYCLTGSTREQALFLFYGTGQNGKSTLVNVLRAIMGDYAMVSPVSTFLAKREGGSGGEASPDLARLPGARLVTAAEPPEGARLDEGKIKEITGGEPIVARHLNQGFFTFRPVFKALISTNHHPTIRGVDHGIWRRIRLLPFLEQITEAEVDRDLETKLLEEGPAILQWMLTGVEEWFAMGLRPPAAAIAAVENYRADQDPVGEFLKDACVLTTGFDPATSRAYETSAKDLYAAYKKWCDGQALEPMTPRTFGTKLTARGIDRRKTGGVKVYLGIVVKVTHQAGYDDRGAGLTGDA
jgi:putative DNA primase/helicase